MTGNELRMFCESLPEEPGLRGWPGRDVVTLVKGRPTKRFFADECGVSFTHLLEIMKGKKPFLNEIISKVLPVMRKYGFVG